VTRFHLFAGVLFAAALLTAACGDKSGSGGSKAAAFPDSVVDEEVIALVNNYPITGKDLRVYALLYGMGTADSLKNERFNENLLEGVIDRTLLWLEAEAVGITVDDSTRDWYMNQFIRATGGEQNIIEVLAKNNLSRSDLMHLIRQDLQVRNFVVQTVATTPTVTDSMAMSYYENNRQQFWSADSVHARHIIIRASQDDTPLDIENKKATLEGLRERAIAGENFAQLAKEYSEGPSAGAGGDLGFFARQDMVQSFSNAAFSLEPGQVSEVVTTPYGYHIIQLIEKKPRRMLEYREIEAQLKNGIAQQVVAQKLQNHLQMSRSVAIIERNY
jgi:peptidyl-prolyl cis-trans isomerase C